MNDGERIEATPFVVRTAADWANDEDKQSEADIGYRRGYCHGYSRAMDDFLRLMRNGFTRPKEVWNILAVHFDDVLMEWRYRNTQYLPPDISQKGWQDLRKQVFARDGRRCSACGAVERLEVDHVVAVKDGGTPKLDNLRVLCQPCNNARNGYGRRRSKRRKGAR